MALVNDWILTLEEVKSITDLTRNIDDAAIKPAMRMVHETRLPKIFGKDLFDALVDQVKNETLTAANSALLDTKGAKDMTAWLVAANSYEHINIKTVNKGVQKRADHVDVDRLKKIAMGHFETYRKQVIAYIVKNISDFPLYNETTDHEIYPREKHGLGSTGIAGLDNGVTRA